jgi:hypothetical protein
MQHFHVNLTVVWFALVLQLVSVSGLIAIVFHKGAKEAMTTLAQFRKG